MKINWNYIVPGYISGIDVLTVAVVCMTLMLVAYTLNKLQIITEKFRRNLWGIIITVFTIHIIMLYTLLGRRIALEPKAELQLFWCIRRAWSQRSARHWYLIVGNISLFIPLGIILPSFSEKLRKMGRVALAGIFVSLTMETIQLYAHVGLFELDDLLHNTLGCVLGYCIFVVAGFFLGKKKDKETIIAFLIWTGVVSALIVALSMGQPVFGQFLQTGS